MSEHFRILARSTADRAFGTPHGDRHRIVGPLCHRDSVVVTFDAELWVWESRQADTWVFVSVPADTSEEIRDPAASQLRRGFGSVRVRASIGRSRWLTSIFPDSPRGCYRLGIKSAVRRAEGLGVGDAARVTIELIDM
jgi:hypothetical protein